VKNVEILCQNGIFNDYGCLHLLGFRRKKYKMKFKPYILVILSIIIVLTLNCFLYADFPQSVSFSRGQQISPLPLNAGFDLPTSVSTSMSGTITATSPTGVAQSVSVSYAAGRGISAQLTMNEIGNYNIQESYTLSVSVALVGQETVSGTRTSIYNNATPGIKTLKIAKSTFSGYSISMPPNKVTVQSFDPLSSIGVELGQSISVNLRVTQNIVMGEVLADSVNVSANWGVDMWSISGGGTANTPPSVTINSASQSLPNGDVGISYTLTDAENDSCTITAQYSKDGTNWSSASISGNIVGVSPGTKSLSWKSALDQPNGQGSYQIRIKANDVIADSAWASSGVTINNTPAINTPPSVTINSASQSQPNGDVGISYTLVDVDNNACTITAQYSKDGTNWLSASIVGDMAGVIPGMKSLSWKSAVDQPSGQGSYQIRIKANDGIADSALASASVTLNNTPVINNPPQALNLRVRAIDATTNQEPVPYHDPITKDKLKAGYSYSDTEGDIELGSELVWYKNGTALPKIVIPPEQNKILTQVVTRGERWYFEITPNDGKTKGTTGTTRRSTDVIIGNAPPVVQNPHIEPAIPTSKDNLKAVYSYSDPENDPQGASEILWYRAAPNQTQYILQSQYTNKDLIPATALIRGEKWKFSLVAKDSLGASGLKVESSIVTIKNQLPIIQNVTVSGTNLTGDVPITFDLVDQDNDVCSLKLWYRVGGSEKRAGTIKGAATPKNVIANINPTKGLNILWLSKEDEPSSKGVCVVGIIPNDGYEDGDEGFSQSFSLNNNTPPKVTDVHITPASPTTNDDLTASYKFEDSNNDQEKDSNIRWYRNKTEQELYRNKKILPSSATKRDEEWYFEIEPGDGKEYGRKEQSEAVKIKNSLPEATNVKLEPANATSGDDLNATYTYKDADEDPETGTQIRWYRDGGLQNDYNDKKTVPATAILKNQTWYFTIKVSDGIEFGQVVESNHVKLGNVAPLVKNLIVPEDGYRDVPVTFELVDSDNDKCSLTVEYRGGLVTNYKQATIKESLTDVSPGSIKLTWDSAKDQNVRESTKFQIRITPNDGSASGTPVESTFIMLDNNIPPIASNLMVSPPNPTTVDNLTAVYDFYDEDSGKDSGSDIRWYKNNGTATAFQGNPLSSSVTLKGDTWYFTVRPRDGAKYGNLETSKSITILNSLPTAKNAVVIPSNPKSGGTLTARYDYRDLDDERESGSEIEWYRNDELKQKNVVKSEEDKALLLPITKDEKWHIVVRPKDGIDFGESVTSESVVVGNAPPSVENLIVTGDTGGIVLTFDLTDIDGDLCGLSVEYQGGTAKTGWFKATIQEPTTKVTPKNGLNFTWSSKIDERGQKSDDYRIRIIPNDGTSDGESVVSLKFTLNNNSLPSATSVAILPEIPTTSDDLQSNYTFVDPDGDKEDKPEIKWYRNGNWELAYDNFKVLPSSTTARGERWHYTIKVYDGKDYGKLEMSSDVIIANELPIAVDVKLTPEFPKIEQPLIANYKYRDTDGDSEQGTKIEWYKNGVYQNAFDNFTTIPGLVHLKGEEWYFTVRPKDGYDFGIPVQSNKVFISNLPPDASSLNMTPVDPKTEDDLVASYVYIDPENDPENGTKISWYKNNVAQPKYDDLLRLPSDATVRKQVWYFTVTPKDGKQFGPLRQSGSVIIGNTLPKASNLSVSPAYPLKKDDLVANYDYFDADGDSEGRSDIRWYNNSVWISKYDGLKKIASKELTDREIWYFTVKPKDDSSFGDMQTSNTVEIGSPIPRVNSLFITPENPFTTDELTANYTYTDPNSVPESVSKIIWYKNGVPQTEYNNLKTLTANATAKGEQWNFSVKPSNGRLSGEEQSSSPVTIINSPPMLTAVVPQPNSPTTNDNILADYIYSDADGDKISKQEIRWFRNGVLQTEYDNLTELLSSVTKRNEEWYYTVRVSDGSVFSDIASSTPVKIRNGKPKASDAVLTPANPKATDDLMATYKYLDTEDDPESGTEITWFKNNVNQQEFHNLRVIPSAAILKGDKWYFTVSPRDGIDFGDSVLSPVVSIDNTNPSAVDIIAEVNQVLRGGTISVSATGKDIDKMDSGAVLNCQIDYKIGDNPWVTLPTAYTESPYAQWKSTFNPDATATPGDYDFRAKFIDTSAAESDWLEKSKLVTVKNSPPIIDKGADDFHVPENAVKEIDLSSYGSDFESVKNVIWSLDENGVKTDMFKASVLRGKFLEIRALNYKNGKSDIALVLTDTDGGKIEKSDVTIIIDPVNYPPTAPTSVKITPENPTTLESLVCSALGSVDPDNDSVVYRYQWYKNGVLQLDLKSQDVNYSKTAKGETWKCEVTSSDGILDGPTKSIEVRIGNVAPSIASVKTTGNTKDIKLTFDLDDPDADLCDMKFEYRLNSGSWKSATTADTLKGVKLGKSLVLTWQSYTDEPNVVISACKLRITANDGTVNSDVKESEIFLLDNKPPEFTVTAVINPAYEAYVDVNVKTDEDISETLPEVSAKLSEQETVKLEMKQVGAVGDNVWTGVLKLQSGFNGIVLINVKCTDILGNLGTFELQKEFNISAPAPIPSKFILKQNYPNPVAQGTSIPYEISESQIVVIKIYNVKGQLIRTMDEGYKAAGFYETQTRASYWDGKDDNGISVAMGVYFYHLKAGKFEAVKKLVVRR